jgi:hypothetical protein
MKFHYVNVYANTVGCGFPHATRRECDRFASANRVGVLTVVRHKRNRGLPRYTIVDYTEIKDRRRHG